MKKWLQNLSSAVIASLLAITLNGKAYANNDEQSTPVVPQPQVQAEQPAGQPASPNFSAEASVVPVDAQVTSSAAPDIQPASASGDNVSASDSDSLSSCNDASVSDSYTPAANALTGGADSLVSSNMPAVTDGDTDGPFENTAVTTDQARMKRGVEDIVSAAGMRGGEVPAGAGDNNVGFSQHRQFTKVQHNRSFLNVRRGSTPEVHPVFPYSAAD